MKCGTAVWSAMRDVEDVHTAWVHRLEPGVAKERMARAIAVKAMYGSLPRHHALARAVFVLLLALLVMVVHYLLTGNVAFGLGGAV
jgi:hypothetical protein